MRVMEDVPRISAGEDPQHVSETFPVEPYLSRDYAQRERDRLWLKVWQIACRVEELPRPGDFVTYEILDQSIIVARGDDGQLRAFHNVCMHRGRRLTEDCGHAKRFQCKFHGWQWSLDGASLRVLEGEDWGDALTPDNLRLRDVRLDTWGGYVFINFDPECEPLRDFLEPAAALLRPYEIGKMRYRWRKWLVMPCNWKVAVEAFNESYHTFGTHPQLMRYSDVITWSRAQGKHANHGVLIQEGMRNLGEGSAYIYPEPRKDYLQAIAEREWLLYETLDAFQSHSIAQAAQRIPVELPPETPPYVAYDRMLGWAREIDAGRGVTWPEVTPEQSAEAGYDWHIFPNTVILQAPTFVLGYRARPNGYDPDSCIFEVYALDRAPEGVEPPQPKPERCDDRKDEAFWGRILLQDFSNMEQVQLGMKQVAFPGIRPNPKKEQAIANFHRVLRSYMED
ncbi:aromatic ring-hydroxylating dioxygenase subunit alpha [Phenylobacterium sp. LjRoot225]|uniref:aromatic ring-hydroxylating oxygenase subunit alpha n=1 Tax=Phenylobacterium sp. LjRoot225 TaxID=3342285 RepID=UPI003ECF65C9